MIPRRPYFFSLGIVHGVMTDDLPGRYDRADPGKTAIASTAVAGPSTPRRTGPKSGPGPDDSWEDMGDELVAARMEDDARSRESESQASSSARQRTPIKARRGTAIRPTASPRRRTPKKPPPPSPRLKEKDRDRAVKSPATVATPGSPSLLRQTGGLLLTTIRVVWTIFDWLISPIKPYLLLASLLFMSAYIAYCVLIYYALPRLPTFLLRTIGILLRPLGGWSFPLIPSWESVVGSSDLDVTRAMGALSLPLSGLATSSCALLGVGCQASLLTTDEGLAQPFWRRAEKEKSGIDDAQLAWALTQESRSARNIFESISTLGRKADVFEHIE